MSPMAWSGGGGGEGPPLENNPWVGSNGWELLAPAEGLFLFNVSATFYPDSYQYLRLRTQIETWFEDQIVTDGFVDNLLVDETVLTASFEEYCTLNSEFLLFVETGRQSVPTTDPDIRVDLEIIGDGRVFRGWSMIPPQGRYAV